MTNYLKSLALSLAAILLLLAGLNAFMNPYGYFDTPKLSGINELALGYNHRLPLAKALAIDHLRPVAIVVGNSRAETGYDPEHPAFSGGPAFNLALGGANIQTARRYILETLAAGRLRYIVLALDFSMFDPSVWKAEEADGEVLLTDAAGLRRGTWHEGKRLATILLSGTALSDSWWSLRHQRRPVANYLPSGLRDDAADIDQVVREGGHHEASLRTESSFLAVALRDLETPSGRDRYHRAMEELRSIAVLARDRGIRMTLVLNPIHARQSYLFGTAGLWPAYEQWKRDLLVASAAGQATEVWDFSGVSACTAEPLPARNDTVARMRWYRETSHFRRTLGDKVLDRISGHGADPDCPDFGDRLEAATLTDTLAAHRRRMAEWVSRHPQDVAEIDALARQYGRRS